MAKGYPCDIKPCPWKFNPVSPTQAVHPDIGCDRLVVLAKSFQIVHDVRGWRKGTFSNALKSLAQQR